MYRGAHLPARQQGVVLFISLIVLIAMTMAGIAMMRQVGTGLGIAGNLAFRQGATSASDRGVELGVTWLCETLGGSNCPVAVANPPLLDSDQSSLGTFAGGIYYSSWDGSNITGQKFDPLNPQKFNWQGFPQPPADNAGNKTQFVIHRLCSVPNTPVNTGLQKCITVQETIGTGSSQTAASYNSSNLSSSNNPYYRITTRTEGPRGTVSYVQVIVKAS